MTLLNGDIFYGEFVNDRFQGHGRYVRVNGYVYDGEYRNGLKHGSEEDF